MTILAHRGFLRVLGLLPAAPLAIAPAPATVATGPLIDPTFWQNLPPAVARVLWQRLADVDNDDVALGVIGRRSR